MKGDPRDPVQELTDEDNGWIKIKGLHSIKSL